MTLTSRFLVIALMTSACSSSSSHSSPPVDAATDGQPAPGDGAPSQTGGPTILSLTTTVSQITEGDTFTIVAVVTESTGLDNLVGGKLTSADGTLTYGAFVAATQGTYNLDLTWAQIDAVSGITFTGQQPLELNATFYNKAGLATTQAVPAVKLYCGSGASPDAACGATCLKIDTVQNCGACGSTCQRTGATCPEAKTCDLAGEIGDVTVSDLTRSCTSYCTSIAAGSCLSTTGEMNDGTKAPLTCVTEIGTYVPVKTAGADIDSVTCECATSSFSKTIKGTCTSFCAMQGETCRHTLATGQVGMIPATQTFLDGCAAPYSYSDWDVTAAPYPNAATINVYPLRLDCVCAAPPTPAK